MPIGEPSPERIEHAQPIRASRAMRRAERFAERGQVAEALEILQQALAFGADAYTCYLRMSSLYRTQGQWMEALSAAQKAVDHHPTALSAREAVVALLLESRDYERAADASKAILRLRPRHIPARDALGAAYIGMGDVESAMRVAEDLVRLIPSDPVHHFKRALLCQHRGDVGMAVSDLEYVIDIGTDPDLAAGAREQLDVLDSFQLSDIMTLAAQDLVFRTHLHQSAEDAGRERGFHLSRQGVERLEEIMASDFTELDTPYGFQQYH